MDLNDKLKDIFKLQNKFSKEINKFQAFQNKYLAVKQMEKFYNNKNLYINPYSLQYSSIFSNLNKWGNILNSSSYKNFIIPNYLSDIQNNNYIFDLFNKKEFIEEFIRENKRILEGTDEPNEENFNVFGQLIDHKINLENPPSKSNSNSGSEWIRKDIIFILFFAVCFYIQNLDQFKDAKEAVGFFINHIDCKGGTISRVNLRIEPNFKSEAIITIPKNSLLLIYEESDNGWVKVKVNLNNIDVEGYVSDAYIRRLK